MCTYMQLFIMQDKWVGFNWRLWSALIGIITYTGCREIECACTCTYIYFQNVDFIPPNLLYSAKEIILDDIFCYNCSISWHGDVFMWTETSEGLMVEWFLGNHWLCFLQMLLYLKEFSQKMMSRTHEIEKQVDTLVHEAKVSSMM